MLPGGIRNSGIRDIHNLNIRFSLTADLDSSFYKKQYMMNVDEIYQ